MQSRLKNDEEGVCFLCGKYANTDVHHIFEGSRRMKSDEHRLIVHLCRDCHNLVHDYKGAEQRRFLHELGQRVFEAEIGSRDEFIDNFIKSFL